MGSLLLPACARAANTCNAFIAITYGTSQTFHDVGDVLDVTVTIGAGSINGGSMATINRVRFELDCDSGGSLGLGCAVDGPTIVYLGDETILADCPTSFSTGHEIGATPNQLVLTPAMPFDIPADNPAFCNLMFSVQVTALSGDVTPDMAEQVTGYSQADLDVECDNGLSSGGSQSGSIFLCPDCNDNDVCTTDTCNRDTGTCIDDPLPPCPSDDNACTIERCDASLGCVSDPRL